MQSNVVGMLVCTTHKEPVVHVYNRHCKRTVECALWLGAWSKAMLETQTVNGIKNKFPNETEPWTFKTKGIKVVKGEGVS